MSADLTDAERFVLAPWDDGSYSCACEGAVREAVEALLNNPFWHRGMYGCPDDMIAAHHLRAALALPAEPMP